jgi:hypothetical protein
VKSYFILAEKLNLIKIGRSGNPSLRFKTIREQVPDKVTLLGVTDVLEQSLHEMFGAHRVQGEWFAVTPELLAFIKENATSPIESKEPCRVGKARTKADRLLHKQMYDIDKEAKRRCERGYMKMLKHAHSCGVGPEVERKKARECQPEQTTKNGWDAGRKLFLKEYSLARVFEKMGVFEKDAHAA